MGMEILNQPIVTPGLALFEIVKLRVATPYDVAY
jgi:hypothetical protein